MTADTARLERLAAASRAFAVVLPDESIETEIFRMRIFLARVILTPPMAIKVTGNPETDENTDLLAYYQNEEGKGGRRSLTIRSLCKSRAMEIDNILAKMEELGEDSHQLMAQVREVFADYTAGRAVLYQ